LRLAISLRTDPGAHIAWTVDEPNPAGLHARQKLHRRPVDEGDVLEIEGGATVRFVREEFLQPGDVLAIDVSAQSEHDRVRRR
jgi:hypothetical protein